MAIYFILALTPQVIDYAKEYLRKRIIKPDEIIIPDEKITLRITYPLSVEVQRQRKQKGGFSRKDLFRWIYEEYKKIYEEEEQQVGDPGTYNMLYNRKESEGPYGIWGHYLNDLYIEFIQYDPKNKVVNLEIGSSNFSFFIINLFYLLDRITNKNKKVVLIHLNIN